MNFKSKNFFENIVKSRSGHAEKLFAKLCVIIFLENLVKSRSDYAENPFANLSLIFFLENLVKTRSGHSEKTLCKPMCDIFMMTTHCTCVSSDLTRF